MKPDDLGPHWETLCTGIRIWRDKAEAQKKEVEAYELFECHKRVFTADFQEKG